MFEKVLNSGYYVFDRRRIGMKKAVLWITFFFMFSGFVYSGPYGSIKGKIHDAAKNPLEGVQVTITSMEYPTEQHFVKTNNKGEFIQIGLSPAYYQVKCEKEGYGSVIKEIRVTLQGFSEVEFEMILAKEVRVEKEVVVDKELRLANKFFQEGNFEAALENYKLAIAKNPSDSNLYYNLGITALCLEKLEEALEAFKKVLELQPQSFSALQKLGELYGKKRDFQTASQYFAKAAAISSNDPEAYYNLGVSLLNTGDPKGAQDAFQKSIACQENYADSYYQLALLYLNQNKLDEARKAFEKFLELAPDDSKAGTAKNMVDFIKKQKG